MRAAWPRRAGWLASPAAVVAALLGVAAVAGAQQSTRIEVNPAMSKGAADAPVTIVEFSDYQ